MMTAEEAAPLVSPPMPLRLEVTMLRARIPASEQEWREIQAALAELEEPS
jgi:hypothetical protein